MANPGALVVLGWLGDGLKGGGSALVADSRSIRMFATRDGAPRAEVLWPTVDSVTLWSETLVGGGEAHALLIRTVTGQTLTFWVDRELAPVHFDDLEALRTAALDSYAGTNHSPPSGGSVSSTDAGRPPNGSAVASTDP